MSSRSLSLKSHIKETPCAELELRPGRRTGTYSVKLKLATEL